MESCVLVIWTVFFDNYNKCWSFLNFLIWWKTFFLCKLISNVNILWNVFFISILFSTNIGLNCWFCRTLAERIEIRWASILCRVTKKCFHWSFTVKVSCCCISRLRSVSDLKLKKFLIFRIFKWLKENKFLLAEVQLWWA